ncbi:MAG: ABC transporter ATP-binding protein [Holophagales bacterium]|nr:ABC transporter ATP-binding protein [Holophagales bacterium]
MKGGAAEEGAPMLEIRGAEKRYGEVVALAGVDLTMDGGIFGLLGANGAGKSSLLKAVLDLVPLDAGQIRVAGLDSRENGVEARALLGYLPEELRLYDRLTGWELLDFVGGLRGHSDTAEWKDWLELFDLWPARDHLIAEYSLGMRKKIGLCAALLGSPPLLLLDEPLNGLDTESMRRFRLRLEAMAEAGTTVVVSSHVMSFVERVCGAMAVLRAGRIVAEGTAGDLRRQVAEVRPELREAPFEDVYLALALGEIGP